MKISTKKVQDYLNGFSLIEVVVVMGILSLLISGAFIIGFPAYNRYALSSEHDLLVDALLESRTRSSVSGELFTVKAVSNGYCIQDSSDLCIVPFHNLPANLALTSNVFSTSTEMVINFISDDSNDNSKDELIEKIIIDQHGFIEGR